MKNLAYLTSFLSVVAAAIAQENVSETKYPEPAPNAPQYQYNAKDGYYYNADEKTFKNTIRDKKSGFYFTVGVAGAVAETRTKYANDNSYTGFKDDDYVTVMPLGRFGYLFPYQLTALPGDPQFFIDVTGSALESKFSMSMPGNQHLKGNKLSTLNVGMSPGLAFFGFENRLLTKFACGPTFSFSELSAPSDFNGAAITATSSSSFSLGISARLGTEYFFTDFFSLGAGYEFLGYVDKPSYDYTVGGVPGKLLIEDYSLHQFQLTLNFLF